MIRIIKKDLNLLFHSKSFYFGFIFLTGFSFLIPYAAISFEPSDSYDPFFVSWSTIIFITTILCTSIFGLTIINKENKQGFIKNVAGMFSNRGLFAISKFITITIAVILWIVFGLCASILTTHLFADNIAYTDFSHFLYMSLLGILLNVSTISVMIFLTVLTRSSIPGVVAGIIICTNVFQTLLSGINYLANKIFGADNLAIEKFIPYENISLLGYEPANDDALRAIIVAIIFIVVFNILSVIVSNKRDIK